MASPARLRIVMLAVLAVLGALLAAPAPAATAVDTGTVRGAIVANGGPAKRIQMQWFTAKWEFLGKRSISGGAYSLRLRPGTYWIQFTDKRPSYDITKFAPSNVKVVVRKGSTTTKNVRMRRGAAITGVAKAGGRPAAGARVVAANGAEQSFATVANKSGQFAIGGLPTGSYSVFTYDRSKKWVGKSAWVPGLKRGKVSNIKTSLNKRAGTLLVDVYAGSQPAKGNSFVTAVSRKTGQFWTAKLSRGSATFAGLYPGRYKLVVPNIGYYFGREGVVKGGNVKPSRPAFGSFRLTKRGGWLTGTAFDAHDLSSTLNGAQILLFDKAGTKLAEARSNADGRFRLDGLIGTQSGLTVVVNPNPDQGGYQQTADGYCMFQRTEQAAKYRSEIGTGTEIGQVVLDRAPDSKQTAETCETGLN